MRPKILGSLEAQIDPEHTALLIIDPQNDFCATNSAVAQLMGWDMSRIQSAVTRLNKFILKAREIQLKIVWTRSLVDPERAKPSSRARSFMQDARIKGLKLVQDGTKGSDWYSDVSKPIDNEIVITKYHYDAFEDTSLDLLLRATGIKTLLLTGFVANVCVETTARHGYIKGYYPVLVSDCTDAATKQEWESTVFNMKTYFGKSAPSGEIIKIWERDYGA